jgi:hypothetical protein
MSMHGSAMMNVTSTIPVLCGGSNVLWHAMLGSPRQAITSVDELCHLLWCGRPLAGEDEYDGV